LRRATASDAPTINAILNRPDIRPHLGPGDEAADIANLLEDGRNVCLFDERGGCIFIWRGPRIFEGHSFFTVGGRKALKAGQEALSMIDADLVWGLTPIGNRKAAWFNRRLGFQSTGTMHTPDMGLCELFEMRF
jgi:hypothetical protein